MEEHRDFVILEALYFSYVAMNSLKTPRVFFGGVYEGFEGQIVDSVLVSSREVLGVGDVQRMTNQRRTERRGGSYCKVGMIPKPQDTIRVEMLAFVVSSWMELLWAVGGFA